MMGLGPDKQVHSHEAQPHPCMAQQALEKELWRMLLKLPSQISGASMQVWRPRKSCALPRGSMGPHASAKAVVVPLQ